MVDKPTTADGYNPHQVELVRAACLYLATKIGDLIDDVVIVGGLVPYLLIDQDSIEDQRKRHVGTLDLDLGLKLGLLSTRRYKELASRLRSSGFVQDRNEKGNPARQTWKISGSESVSVDFLIEPSLADDKGGTLRNLEPDFAAWIVPGLRLAFEDKQQIEISGYTLLGEKATRSVGVCGPGAFLVLKALAFGSRGENKDAYDLFYLLRHFGHGVADVVAAFKTIQAAKESKTALAILEQDFLDFEGLGPKRVAAFLTGGSDDGIQADVVGFVREFLDLI